MPGAWLTREYSGHQCCEHQEEHTEEQTASIAEHLAGLVADAQVQQANQDAHRQVRYQTQAGQGLGTGETTRCQYIKFK